MSTTEELRGNFEKWAAERSMLIRRSREAPFYESERANLAWEAWKAAYSQGYNDAREACQAAVASELYGHDTGDMGNRIQEAISSLPIPEAQK